MVLAAGDERYVKALQVLAQLSADRESARKRLEVEPMLYAFLDQATPETDRNAQELTV